MFGFVNSLEDILRRSEGAFLAVVYDQGDLSVTKSFPIIRLPAKVHQMLSLRCVYHQRAGHSPGVKSYEVMGYVADDVIGTIAKKVSAEYPNMEIFLVTSTRTMGNFVTGKSTYMLVLLQRRRLPRDGP